jgi:hypothetical protein
MSGQSVEMAVIARSPKTPGISHWEICESSGTSIVIIAIILSVLAIAFISELRHWRYRCIIYRRTPTMSDWTEVFPNDMPTVEGVLAIFCDAFMFKRRYTFHFHPEDVVMHVYRHTTGPIADELQMERLTMDIRKSFGVDVADTLDENATLRDIVQFVIRHRNSARSDAI